MSDARAEVTSESWIAAGFNELARTGDPIIGSLPTLSEEEYEYRKAVYS